MVGGRVVLMKNPISVIPNFLVLLDYLSYEQVFRLDWDKDV